MTHWGIFLICITVFYVIGAIFTLWLCVRGPDSLPFDYQIWPYDDNKLPTDRD